MHTQTRLPVPFFRGRFPRSYLVILASGCELEAVVAIVQRVDLVGLLRNRVLCPIKSGCSSHCLQHLFKSVFWNNANTKDAQLSISGGFILAMPPPVSNKEGSKDNSPAHQNITRHFIDVMCQCFTSPFAFTASKTFLVFDAAVLGRNRMLEMKA